MNKTHESKSTKQILAVMLLLCLLVPILQGFTIHAIAEETDATIAIEVEMTHEPTPTEETIPSETPAPTQEPLPPESPYKITFSIPKGWSNTATASIKIRVADKQSVGWRTVEVKFRGGEWQDVSARFIEAQDDKIDMDIGDNGRLFVRVTDFHGNEYKEETDINCFDRTAPTVTAGIDDLLLHVEAIDTQSGLAGIQVNGLLFTTLENGILNVRFEEALLKYEKLAIRAFDFVGNFSEPVTLDNPYYGEPLPEVTPTPVPTATCAPTATPAPTAAPEPTATPKPTKNPSQSSGSQATATPVPTATAIPVVLPTAEPVLQVVQTPAPIITTEYIPLGPGMPYKAQGNMSTLDLLYAAHTNKQFITVQTKGGATFFMVIDYDKPIDEAAELYETYFLNLVDERDLLSLLSDEEMPTPTPVVIMATPEPTAVPVVTAPPVEPVKESDNSMMLFVLVAVIALGGGGAYVFLQSKKSKKRNGPDMDDFIADDDDDDELPEEQDV